jgi:hypothetical protein
VKDVLAAAQDWLLDWVLAQDHIVHGHFWHISDGEGDTCGCPLQGEGTE